MEMTNLSDAEFKTLVVRSIRQLPEYGKKIKEEMKVTLSEMKKNPQGTNSEGKEDGIQINNSKHKEEINIQPEQKEETSIKKNEDRLRNFWDISKSANIWIIGMPEGEEIENLFEKIMKENFPNLVKEKYISPGSTESPKQVGSKEDHTKTHHN